jgi:hypothetical protein
MHFGQLIDSMHLKCDSDTILVAVFFLKEKEQPISILNIKFELVAL